MDRRGGAAPERRRGTAADNIAAFERYCVDFVAVLPQARRIEGGLADVPLSVGDVLADQFNFPPVFPEGSKSQSLALQPFSQQTLAFARFDEIRQDCDFVKAEAAIEGEGPFVEAGYRSP